jgi:hypothetical protein
MLPVTREAASNLKAWVILDPTNGNTSVTVIYKDEEASGTVGRTVPGYTPGVVTRLLAPSFSAEKGVTWVGRTFNGSRDGRPVGTKRGEPVTSKKSAFKVTVGPASAFLLTLKK